MNHSHIDPEGPVGTLGYPHETSYVIVDADVQWCKVIQRSWNSKELAEEIIKQNKLWKNVTIITSTEFADAWNKRFASYT